MDDHYETANANIPAKEIYATFNYEPREYFVSGQTSGGTRYQTHIVIRKPRDNTKFNGLILAESMHPSGNPWVFNFTQVYAMTNGVIGLGVQSDAQPLFLRKDLRCSIVNSKSAKVLLASYPYPGFSRGQLHHRGAVLDRLWRAYPGQFPRVPKSWRRDRLYCTVVRLFGTQGGANLGWPSCMHSAAG